MPVIRWHAQFGTSGTIRDLFKKARSTAPSIIFLDEIDAMVGNRSQGSDSSGVQERVLATLLTEMDGVEAAGHVLIVGATNRPDMLDAAFTRPGTATSTLLLQHFSRVSQLYTTTHMRWVRHALPACWMLIGAIQCYA